MLLHTNPAMGTSTWVLPRTNPAMGTSMWVLPRIDPAESSKLRASTVLRGRGPQDAVT